MNNISMYKFKNLKNDITYITKGKDIYTCYMKANKIVDKDNRKDVAYYVQSGEYTEKYFNFLNGVDVICE